MKNSNFIEISFEKLHKLVFLNSKLYVNNRISKYIADKIILTERMGVPSHGVNYFLSHIMPLLKKGMVNKSINKNISNNILYSQGIGGVGYYNLKKLLDLLSKISEEHKIGLLFLKNPGKVGALRIYCQEYMNRGQLILLLKNTARTIGLLKTREPVLGTNPICIGFPNTHFIYDSSTSTVATNKVKYEKSKDSLFDYSIGVNKNGIYSNDPKEVLDEKGFLFPFSFGNYWFKSFFLSMVIESIASIACGETSKRVGDHLGSRLYSDEGMVAFIIDKTGFPDYNKYLSEIKLLIKDIRSYGLRIPGQIKNNSAKLQILKKDYNGLLNEISDSSSRKR
jgi:LDH2 family malate/lactate/ureidoglycolate dehydrogenase